MKKKLVIIFLLMVVLIMTVFVYFFYFSETKNELIEQNSSFSSECLSENLEVSYIIEKENVPLVDIIIKVNDKNTKETIQVFKIEKIFKTSTSIELHHCGVYVIREFNFDFKKYKPLADFSVEIWKYRYKDKRGERLLVLAGENNINKIEVNYGYDFRVDSNEKYIVLGRGYLGKEDYALVIKDLKTKEDIFELSAESIQKQNPNIVGVFDLLEWSEDGRYFWGSVSMGAYVSGYFRIDTTNWKVNIFDAPNGAMGGSRLNINTGNLPIQPGQVWTGDYQFTQELKEKYRKEGKFSSLYLYNLFTENQILLATTSEPLWWFKSQWISDTELEYYLPSGEKQIFRVENE